MKSLTVLFLLSSIFLSEVPSATTETADVTSPTDTSMSQPTTARANTSGTTKAAVGTIAATSSTSLTVSTTAAVSVPDPGQTPSFEVKNLQGEVCMLLVFNATMKVQYETNDRGLQETMIPVTGAADFEGDCDTSPRTFTLWYPTKNLYCAVLALFFNEETDTKYYMRNGVTLRYIEPCFQQDAVLYNQEKKGYLGKKTYDGTIGKTFKCDSVRHVQTHFDFVMEDVMIQPFAQKSSDKGHFGEVETCSKALPTTEHPKTRSSKKPSTTADPSPSNAGMIAGVVIGVLAAVAIVVGIAVFVVRKRRRGMSYDNI